MLASNDQSFMAEIIHVSPLPSLGVGKFVVSTKIGQSNTPKVGFYLTFPNRDIWKITGIVTVGIDKEGKEIISKRHLQGLWDLVLEPVLASNHAPICGKVEISSHLPSSVIENDN